MASREYVYNTRDAANFAAYTPIFWCLFVAWIIFASYIGQAGMYGNLGGTFVCMGTLGVPSYVWEPWGYLRIIKANKMHCFLTLIWRELRMFRTDLLSIIRSLNIVFPVLCS